MVTRWVRTFVRRILTVFSKSALLRRTIGSFTRRFPRLHARLVRIVHTPRGRVKRKRPNPDAPRDRIEANLSAEARRLYRELRGSRDVPVQAGELEVAASPSARLRLAYVSPLPPLKTGIADYSSELIPALSYYYDIDLIVDQDIVADSWVREHCAVRDLAWFREHAGDYDRILYHIGNARFHHHMFDCLAAYPGVVVLHDFYLGDVQAYREFEAGDAYAWSEALYESHGYAALKERCAGHVEAAAIHYPANFPVLRAATGVIVHSSYSRKLADDWYGAGHSRDWTCIPHLRVREDEVDRMGARARLAIAREEFVVCAFGVLGRGKLNHCLLEAWRHSALGRHPQCRLVFVGENPGDEYGRAFARSVEEHALDSSVSITGWADRSTFRDYLAVADVAVQLRGFSRGETSGTVLDCMNHGVPTIVNACGSMTDLPGDAVWMLPEEFEEDELIDALEALHRNAERRNALADKARRVIRERHDPAACAALYAQAIEKFHGTVQSERNSVLRRAREHRGLPVRDEELAKVASAIARDVPSRAPGATLFVDVSVTSRTDLRTGIERVTRALLSEFLQTPPKGYRVEPVYLSDEGGVWHYRHARHYALEMMGCPPDMLPEDPILPRSGDMLFCADLAADMVVRADHHGVFRQLRETGVTVSFMVHDLLPVTMPNVFPPDAGHAFKAWLGIVVKVADVIVCVSRAVKADLERWLATEGDDANPRLRIGWSHHGANIQASAPTRGLPHGAKRVLDKLRKRPSFLCVGTLEPRKGYAQVVDAFEQLWREGVDVNLVIVGKEGWKNLPDEQRRDIPQLAQRLKWHREKGRRLFWLDDISDEYLEQLYTTCDCLLAASLGEGFGLPLIEASRAGIPLLLRDIPVFREVAGNHATYFEGTDAAALAKAITAWIEGKRGDAGTLPQLTWRRSARNLLALIRPPSSDGDTNRARRLYVDVSVVARNDFRTGIQRVVRALFAAMIQAPPQNYEVYPVRLERHAGHWRYEYAGGFLERYCRDGANPRALRGEIETKAGDTLLGLDLAGSMVVDAARDGLYDILRDDGVFVAFVVYDLLPVTAPQFFSDADGVMHEAWLRSIGDADQLLCISETVAEEYRTWYRATFDENAAMPVVQSFPLGCDIENTAPTRGMPAEADPLLAALKARPTFLMVGTLEPRKRYDHALDAFRRLWSEGIDANLVIVGKQGWNVDAFASELRADPESGRRLHWLEGISDEYLEAVYAAADCLLATSADEGFGLPLIEAARRGLPLLLRDIPVFRELASEHAFYFNGAGAELAAAVREWLALNAEGAAPASNGIRCVTWQESAQALLQRLINASADAESTGMEGRQ